MEPDELQGLLADLLGSDPATSSMPDIAAIAAAVRPALLEVAATNLTMVADELAMEIENPEQPWSQGVQHAVDELRTRATQLSSS